MNRTTVSLLTLCVTVLSTISPLLAAPQKFRHVPSGAMRHSVTTIPDNQTPHEISDTVVLTPAEILDSIQLKRRPTGDFVYSALIGPWVLKGFRAVHQPKFSVEDPVYDLPPNVENNDTISQHNQEIPEWIAQEEHTPVPDMETWIKPEWLTRSMAESRFILDVMQSVMVNSPNKIDYLYSTLPEPVRPPADDTSFHTFLQRLSLPEIDRTKAEIEVAEIEKRHWLHVFNTGIHFSQAYVSPNWYQGGNNYLALLFNFLWDVNLNQVYHPNLLFQNTVSYKLSLNSNPKEQLHRYNISEDIFQWNMKAGVKAFQKWFYSFTLQFKTQFLVNYPADSWTRTASFLSPSDLNLGLGMTYSTANKKKTLKFVASISPISYNLRTCIDPKVDHAQFNIKPGHKYHNEIGSTAELTLDWKWASNITYRSRLFLFSNYDYFLSDWENTISFNINRFLSTQIYVHLRYDTSSDASVNRWRHLMLKEILSFGFTYAFSTKQK